MTRSRLAALATAGLAACASLLALGPGATAAVQNSSAQAPAAGARVPVVAVRGTNGALYVHTEGVPGYRKLGGVISTAPSLVPAADGVMYYIAGVPNGNVYARTDTLPWRAMRPTGGANCREPGAAINGATIYVGCRGGNDRLYIATGTVTSGQVPTLGTFRVVGAATDTIASGPAMVFVKGVVTSFVTRAGTGRNVFAATQNGAFTPLPFGCVGRPAIGRAVNLGITWFACTGPDRALYASRHADADPLDSGWQTTKLGGVVLFSPGIAVAAEGTGMGFVEGSDRMVYSHPLALPANGFTRVGGFASEGGVAARQQQG